MEFTEEPTSPWMRETRFYLPALPEAVSGMRV
jgi:hypothetical protein